MKTYVPKKESLPEKWLLVDAEGQTLGRLSTFVASRLQGKHRPDFSPAVDNGDFVIVVNAAKIRLTGRKLEQKIYRTHTGRPGSLKEVSAGKLLKKKPSRVLERAIFGMLPKNTLGRKLQRKVKVYAGPEHPHQAQKPEPVAVRA